MPIENIVTAQAAVFFQSLALGALLGGLYDLLRVFRVAFPPGDAALFTEDFLYFFAAAFLTFSFLLEASNGQLRFFIFFGEALGFLLWYLTAGALIMRVAKAVVTILRRAIEAVTRPILRLGRLICIKIRKTFRKIKIFIQFMAKASINLLQKYSVVVYNKFSLVIRNRASRIKNNSAGGKKRFEDKDQTAKRDDSSVGDSGLRGLSRVFRDQFSG